MCANLYGLWDRVGMAPCMGPESLSCTFVSHVYLGINVFEINIEREGKEKLASFSTIMTGNVDSSL